MKQKIQTLLVQLNNGLVERESAIKSLLLTVLAGENPVLIGPPGTAKSLLARRIAEGLALDGEGGYFEYLLTKFSTPEEIFGPLSITELKADRFKRNTAGYLPTAEIAFLDEIFKASSSILNSLLTILNERVYHNGAQSLKIPLQSLIGASNELPAEQEELNALYDRFLVRIFVYYVSLDQLPQLFAQDDEWRLPASAQLTAADREAIQSAASKVTLPPQIVELIQRIWAQHQETFKEDRRERLSDRRLKKIIKLLRVSAATNGRKKVDLSDVFLLKDCLWNHQENALKVREIIQGILPVYSQAVAKKGRPQLPVDDETPVYEVGKDGTTLIPVHPKKNAVAAKSSKLTVQNRTLTTLPGAKVNAVLKGFKGSGTAQAPILIETVEDLTDLIRPEVGLQGYHFRQTADIDCSGLEHWSAISFKGHYDGGGYAITDSEENKTLFKEIKVKSSVVNIELKNIALAFEASGADVIRCQSTSNLIQIAEKCTISACQSGSLMIDAAKECTISNCRSEDSLAKNVQNCKISFCSSESFLIDENAVDCKITDCHVVFCPVFLDYDHSERGGLSCFLENSQVERCFVSGYLYGRCLDYPAKISGITSQASHSIIRQCACGTLDLESPAELSARIAFVSENCRLENNASISSNSGEDNPNGPDGRTVSAALFKQRFFEHTLGWDFDTVWEWDNVAKRPKLRQAGLNAAVKPTKPSAAVQKDDMTDLLAEQMRANIWL